MTPEQPSSPDTRENDPHRAEAMAYASDSAETKRVELLGDAQNALNEIVTNRDPNDQAIQIARNKLLDSVDGIIAQANTARASADILADQANRDYSREVRLQNQLNKATGKPEVNSEYEKMQVAKEQIKAMEHWLIADKTYPDSAIDQVIGGLSVEYDEESQEAVVKGNLDLNSLTSAEGLNLPTTIGGYLGLRGLTSAKGLNLPNSIGGYLGLDSLTNAEGLNLPTTISGDLNLTSLTNAEGLILPTTIGRKLYLDSLTSSAEKDVIRAKYPHLYIK